MREEDVFEWERIPVGRAMRVLIIYDITNNRDRLRLSNFLQGYGERVQRSAFEAKLNARQLKKMNAGIAKFWNGRDADPGDSVRVYKIVGQSQVTAWSEKEADTDTGFVLV